jgi:hypothetical protein
LDSTPHYANEKNDIKRKVLKKGKEEKKEEQRAMLHSNAA